MAEQVLVDTSVWIPFFRRRDHPPWRGELAAMVAEARVAVAPVVLAELLYGAVTERERATIRDLAEGARIVEPDVDTWLAAGDLGRSLRSRGRTLSITDCVLAAVARREDLPLWTLDRDFDPLVEEGLIVAWRPQEVAAR